MLSEEEAKTKWCPKVRVTAGTDGVGHAEWHTNRPSHAEVHEKNFDRCVGSACMAWRWGPRFWIDPDETSNPKTRHSTDHKPGMELEPAKGFCGLAGPSS